MQELPNLLRGGQAFPQGQLPPAALAALLQSGPGQGQPTPQAISLFSQLISSQAPGGLAQLPGLQDVQQEPARPARSGRARSGGEGGGRGGTGGASVSYASRHQQVIGLGGGKPCRQGRRGAPRSADDGRRATAAGGGAIQRCLPSAARGAAPACFLPQAEARRRSRINER